MLAHALLTVLVAIGYGLEGRAAGLIALGAGQRDPLARSTLTSVSRPAASSTSRPGLPGDEASQYRARQAYQRRETAGHSHNLWLWY